MKNFSYSLTGSTGTIGNEIKEGLIKEGETVNCIKTKRVSEKIQEKGLDFNINEFNACNLQECTHHCLIFCHRLRLLEANPELAVAAELILTRSIINAIKQKTQTLNIIWIGSCTGRKVHSNSQEGYHYVKDLQKSISRYTGIHNANIISNTIELSIFEKYSKIKQSREYANYLNEVKSIYNRERFASYRELVQTIKYLANPGIGQNGDTFNLDLGVNKIQAW